MATRKTKRLSKTLIGHYHELQATFARTAAHKLPSAMGALREDGVANFIETWLQKRYSAPTNVFATTRAGNEYPSELDLIIHDGDSGAIWKLDSQAGNSVATWEEIRLVAQIKSTLDEKEFEKACKTMSTIDQFSKDAGTERPITLLFAYKVDQTFDPLLLEKFVYSPSGAFPFDAFILLDHGAYFSDSLRELRIGIEKGLSPKKVQNDGPSQDRVTLEYIDTSHIPNGYRFVGDASPESTLLALAALATFATAGDAVTQALLAACVHSEYFPIFD